jgi:antitoxin CptB
VRVANDVTDDLDTRRRRALWRAQHRGTKEMDVLLGRYAETAIARMDASALAHFERFMALPEPQLQTWLLDGDAAGQDSDFAGLVAEVRAFHGLVPRPDLTGRAPA